jgi:hypothetical protein
MKFHVADDAASCMTEMYHSGAARLKCDRMEATCRLSGFCRFQVQSTQNRPLAKARNGVYA